MASAHQTYGPSLTHPWHKRMSWLASQAILAPAQLYQALERFADVTCPDSRQKGVPARQRVVDHLDYTGAHAICNDARDQRPMPPALEAVVRQQCPIDIGMVTPVATYEAEGIKLHAYIPSVPHLPQQLEIPLGEKCRTDLNELSREELHAAFLFAKQLIRTGHFYRPGIDEVHVEVHFGIVGSQRGHWRVILGGVSQQAQTYSRSVFQLSGKYMEETGRDVAWEALQSIWAGPYQDYLVEGFGTDYKTSSGALLFVPHVQRSGMEGRVALLDETYKGIDDMPDLLLECFVEGLYSGIRRFGSIRAETGALAVRNLEVLVHSVPLSLRDSCSKARVFAGVLVRDRSAWGGIEVGGSRVTTAPTTTANLLRSNTSFTNAVPPDQTRIIHPVDIRELGSQPFRIQSDSIDGGRTFEIVVTEGPASSRKLGHEVLVDPLAPKTTVVVPGIWSGDVSHIAFPAVTIASGGLCIPCNPSELGDPRVVPVAGEGTIENDFVVANPFAFGGGDHLTQREVQMFTTTGIAGIRLVPGAELPDLSYTPGHLVIFPSEHITSIEEFTRSQVERMLRRFNETYTGYFALKLGDPASRNRRIICLKNLGLEAGGTIAHLHDQIVELSQIASLWPDKKMATIATGGRLKPRGGYNPYNFAEALLTPEGITYGTDLFGARVFETVTAQNLDLFPGEFKHLRVYSEPFCIFPFEVAVSMQRWGASNRSFLTPEEKLEEQEAVHRVFELYRKIGVEQLNLVDEGGWVGDRSTLWRHTVRLMPRMIQGKVARIGTSQLNNYFIVPVHPRDAAHELRIAARELGSSA
ncbi:MAG: hypothetical protein NT099_06325 [Candidatus Saganbacteria bacterium]|nr:hypothetical protein [Candidatus Saganbacteria bacterium]